jgi:hypothetical protein
MIDNKNNAIQKKLFPDDVYITHSPKSAITLRELFRRNLFQCSKNAKRFVTRHELSDDRFIELHGYANVTDQDVFFAVHYFARTHFRSFKISGQLYDNCIVIKRHEFLSFLGINVSGQGSKKEKIDSSLTRLQGLVINHNIFKNQKTNFGFFEACGYDYIEKVYYFAVSKSYSDILFNSKELKSFFMADYFKLKNNLAKILDPVLRVHFDADHSKIKLLKLETILKLANKKEWMENASDKHYLRRVIDRDLIPAFSELESNDRFKFKITKGDKCDLDSVWEVERLYEIESMLKK